MTDFGGKHKQVLKSAKSQGSSNKKTKHIASQELHCEDLKIWSPVIEKTVSTKENATLRRSPRPHRNMLVRLREILHV